MQKLIFLLILLFEGAMASAAMISATPEPSAPATISQSDAQSADDDGDDWIFDPGLYTDDPATGQRTEQYAKQKPVYRNPSQFPPATPRYYGMSDPFFLPSTDMMFFQTIPDPFFAEPEPYPSYYGGSGGRNYGIDWSGSGVGNQEADD